jgi:HAMP domain-containing protein
MRSPIGPILVLLGLATVVVLVLLVFQGFGLRSDLERAQAELASLRQEVAEKETGVDDAQLTKRLDELEGSIRDWLIATGVDGPSTDGSPAGSAGDPDEISDRLDEILRRIGALDDRIDEICDGVPVC